MNKTPQRNAALTLYWGRQSNRGFNFPANLPGIGCPVNSQAAGAGGKEPAHPANVIVTPVISVDDRAGMTD